MFTVADVDLSNDSSFKYSGLTNGSDMANAVVCKLYNLYLGNSINQFIHILLCGGAY